jgi:hypothetical protein
MNSPHQAKILGKDVGRFYINSVGRNGALINASQLVVNIDIKCLGSNGKLIANP